MARVSYGAYVGTFGAEQNNAVVFAPKRQPSRPPCYSLDELTNAIREEIEAGAQSSVPECTTSELSLALSAWVPLHRPNIGPYAEGGEHDLPAEFKTSWTNGGKDGTKQYPQATVQDIISLEDQHDRQTVQRAASRGILAAVEAADGFKYSFNNAWAAKDDDGMRFSYICQDSTQNKDRHANGFTRTLKHLKGEGERGPRKPTFDCRGSVSVKCSLQRECVDIYYRHYAIHPKVKERQPFRKSSSMLRQDYNPLGSSQPASQHNEETGGLFAKLQAENSAYDMPSKPQAMTEVDTHQASNIGRPLKRKRETDAPVQSRNPDKTLSLAELLKQSEAAKPKPNPKATPAKTAKAPVRPPPLNYDLPSWQPPDPVPVAKPPKQRSNPPPESLPPSYQPPYQPTPTRQAHNRPVLIDRNIPPPPPAQKYLGLPKAHPQGQGLFTTMKPVPKEPRAGTGFLPMQHSPRASVSCTNCRYAKRKVGIPYQGAICNYSLTVHSAMNSGPFATLASKLGRTTAFLRASSTMDNPYHLGMGKDIRPIWLLCSLRRRPWCRNSSSHQCQGRTVLIHGSRRDELAYSKCQRSSTVR